MTETGILLTLFAESGRVRRVESRGCSASAVQTAQIAMQMQCAAFGGSEVKGVVEDGSHSEAAPRKAGLRSGQGKRTVSAGWVDGGKIGWRRQKFKIQGSKIKETSNSKPQNRRWCAGRPVNLNRREKTGASLPQKCTKDGLGLTADHTPKSGRRESGNKTGKF